MTENIGIKLQLKEGEREAFDRALKKWPKDKPFGKAVDKIEEGGLGIVELDPEFHKILMEELCKET